MASIRDAEEFERHRALLFSLAYRMLGSAAEAEDMVQDAYLRYAAAPPREPGALQSYLCTIVTRLCLDQLKSARRQREEYIGPWLPEPLLTAEADLAPSARAEQRDSISLAFLTLLERLGPVERAALLLHDVFDYSYEETAEMVQVSVANCRQVCHRARERLAAGSEGPARFEAAPELHRRLTERFLAACLHGDVQGLTAVLAQDVTVWSDGGGKVSAATRPVQGRDHTVRFIMGLLRKGAAGLRPTVEEVNGVPGILLWRGETLVNVVSFDVAEGHIQGLRFVLNPDKLLFLQSQLRALRR